MLATIVSALLAASTSDNNHGPFAAHKPVHVARTSAVNPKNSITKTNIVENMLEKVGNDVGALTNKVGTIVRQVGTDGPPTGTIGQIRCGCNVTSGPLVCFPGWTGGHDGNGFLDTCADVPLASCGPTSNWWMHEDGLEDVDTSLCGGKFKVGDAVFANTTNPSGATNLKKGMIGQIYCGASGLPPIGVNWGTGYTGGHDGNTAVCSTGTNMPLSSDTSNYYVECDEISALATTK